jgi:hypothetical protein
MVPHSLTWIIPNDTRVLSEDLDSDRSSERGPSSDMRERSSMEYSLIGPILGDKANQSDKNLFLGPFLGRRALFVVLWIGPIRLGTLPLLLV